MKVVFIYGPVQVSTGVLKHEQPSEWFTYEPNNKYKRQELRFSSGLMPLVGPDAPARPVNRRHDRRKRHRQSFEPAGVWWSYRSGEAAVCRSAEGIQINSCDGRSSGGEAFGRGFDSRQVHQNQSRRIPDMERSVSETCFVKYMVTIQPTSKDAARPEYVRCWAVTDNLAEWRRGSQSTVSFLCR